MSESELPSGFHEAIASKAISRLRAIYRDVFGEEIDFEPGSPMHRYFHSRFELTEEEVGELDTKQVRIILTYIHRLRHAVTDEERQSILREIAEARSEENWDEFADPDNPDVFAKALSGFEEPETEPDDD